MSERYDAVVVGAGCAGALLAMGLAAGGNSVLLLDRKAGDWSGPRTRDLIEEESLDSAGLETGRFGERPGGIEVVSPYTATRVSVPGGRFRVVEGRALLEHLLEGAREAGARLMSGCVAGGTEIHNGFVTGVTTDRGTFSCRLAVDASGPERVLCRTIPSGMGIPRRIRSGDHVSVYREARRLAVKTPREAAEEVFRFYIGRYGGYSWTCPGGDGTVDIGTAVQDRAGSPDPREILLGYVRSEPSVGEEVLAVDGGRIATRRPLNTMVTNGLMVVGDAACQATPVIARGTGGALLGGSLAAAAAVRALSGGEASTAALWSYNSEYMRARGADMAALDCLRLLMQHMTEKEFSWSMARGVIDEQEIAAALRGRFEVPTAQVKIRNVLKGLSGVPLLVRYDGALKLAGRVQQHYREYPSTYDAEAFADWAQGADFLLEDAEKV